MNKLIALKLSEAARGAAELFSKPDRDKNFDGETFTLDKITPLSENTAIVVYIKSSGKRALAFFYYLNMSDGHWRYFFPTDSHILGMRNLPDLLWKLEKLNFEYNFNKEDLEVEKHENVL